MAKFTRHDGKEVDVDFRYYDGTPVPDSMVVKGGTLNTFDLEEPECTMKKTHRMRVLREAKSTVRSSTSLPEERGWVRWLVSLPSTFLASLRKRLGRTSKG